jgi:uncharacterized protein YecE (DUF72 family)
MVRLPLGSGGAPRGADRRGAGRAGKTGLSEAGAASVVGTAGWSIPAADASHFPSKGSALQRYSSRFAGVEINSSFHRSHRRSTWERWAESVPDGFRFAVKVPKTITHQRKLVDCADPFADLLAEAGSLGDKLSILLLQLPPKLAFDPSLVETFFRSLPALNSARLVCEPRHPSWFEAEPDSLLDSLGIARVAGDPACVPEAAHPGGWRGLSYVRLHGSPIMYRSSYDEARIADLADLLRREREAGREAWCMFDNTASSAATGNALALGARLGV